MRRTIIGVALILLVGGAWFITRSLPEQLLPAPNLAVTVSAECAAFDSVNYFFPPKVFRSWGSGPEDAPRVYYGLFLTAMEEPSLSCGDRQPDAYRLTRLQYTGVPLSVRVVRNRRIELFWTKLEAPTWMLPPGKVLGRDAAPVSNTRWHAFEAALKAADFWNLPTNEPPSSSDGPGTAWIVEGRRGRQYHIVNRSSPLEGPYRAAGLMLLRLAGISEAELEGNAPGVTVRPFKQAPHILGLPPPPPPPPR